MSSFMDNFDIAEALSLQKSMEESLAMVENLDLTNIEHDLLKQLLEVQKNQLSLIEMQTKAINDQLLIIKQLESQSNSDRKWNRRTSVVQGVLVSLSLLASIAGVLATLNIL